MITAKELALKIGTLKYPVRIAKDIVKEAKESGLVIVYGSSDDLMEFKGAIYDEVGVYDGGEVYIDSEGIIPDFENLDKDDESSLESYFSRKGKGKKIEALWCKEKGYSFTYKTDIPHEAFEVVEDEEPYCRGIVFSMSDVTSTINA